MVKSVVDSATTEAWKKILSELPYPIVTTAPTTGYYITTESGRLCVKNQSKGPRFLIDLDPDKEWRRLKTQRLSHRKDLLARAVGFKGQPFRVVDGTLGFGKDSLHLLALGCEVKAYEKEPLLQVMWQGAIENALFPKENFSLTKGDCADDLEAIKGWADCLYLDPMFEDTDRKSAPKKDLAFLRELVAVPTDFSMVIQKAIKLGIRRIVVKRPLRHKPLSPGFRGQVSGPMIRYDIY